MSQSGVVVSLHVAATAAAPVQTVTSVEAVVGLGLQGDRYFNKVGTFSNDPGSGRHVTLIESEAIEALEREYHVEIDAALARRNVVTSGTALNHLVGRRFTVGPVMLRGTRLCEPCAHLEKLTRPGTLRGLIHRGGLRAEIVSGGVIRVGDAIAPLAD
ncbi:MAG TPA: MOSC domain-containing protein [Verrucomicrobiae bacterium]|nr:MOSC domain-containing protein [Verrucomicrobiae bacterium]